MSDSHTHTAGGKRVEKTCAEKYEDERAKAEFLASCLEGNSAPQMLNAFMAPEHITDMDQFGKQVLEYLFNREPCNEALGNNAAVHCGCSSSSDGCCGCAEETGCDDPDQCHTFVCGWNYVALARAAEHAVSLEYMPIVDACPRGEGPQVLIWDDTAIPSRWHCNPCYPRQAGAWKNVGLAELGAAIAAAMEEPEESDPDQPQGF